MSMLTQNAIRLTESDTYMVSTSVDDRPCVDIDGVTISIGGGNEYAQRVPVGPYTDLLERSALEEWSLTSDDSFERACIRMLYQIGAHWKLIAALDDVALEEVISKGNATQRAVAAYWVGFHKARKEGCGCHG